MNRGDRDKQLVEVICNSCGINSTTTYGHYRRNKEGPFYCKTCAQTIRVNAVNKIMTDKEREIRRIRMKKHNPMHHIDDETKEIWKGKISESRKKTIDELTDEQKRIFGDKWSTMTQDERYKYSFDIKCSNCGQMFSITYGHYTKTGGKNREWRCKICRYEKHGEIVKQQWENRSPSESAAIRIKQQTSSISTRKNPNKLEDKFIQRFKSSYLYNRFEYKQHISIDNIRGKIWDFGIYDRSTNQLVAVVDVDGSYYHGDIQDYNGYHSQQELDEDRYNLVPEGIKLSIIYENEFYRSFEKLMKDMDLTYDEFIEDQFQMCREMSFPYPKYNDKELIQSWNRLQKSELVPSLYKNIPQFMTVMNTSRLGDRLVQHFHHSIYHANRKNNISPYEAWHDDDLLRKVIQNRMIYANPSNPNKILQGFNVSKIAPKVSVFSPFQARLLISAYLSDYNTIFDPFSGFSGRMLGAISLDKKYVGQDISNNHISESSSILTFLESNSVSFDVSLSQKDIFNSSGTYEALFTCPPYGDKEQWQDISPSITSCDDWIDECLNRFHCKKYLFVVDKTERYKSHIITSITNQSYTTYNKEYIVLI